MTGPVAKASLVALSTEAVPKEIDRLEFDFNPETLQIRVTIATAPNTAVGKADLKGIGSSRSLSFDAVFDNTRPRATAGGGAAGASLGLQAGVELSASAGASAGAGASGIVSVSAGASASFSAAATASASVGVGGGTASGQGSDDALDVRRRTGKILAWATGAPKAPVSVEFRWGRIAWRGAIESFSETIDYFSSTGIPLRSKVSISIKEASAENREDAAERKSKALALGFAAGASASLDFSASAGFGLGASASVGLGASAGFSAGMDFGFSAGAGVAMSADLALSVFGGAAASAAFGGDVDLSASAPPARPSVSMTPTAWAPNGPPAGTVAAATARLVTGARAAGAASALLDPAADTFRATNLRAPSVSGEARMSLGTSTSAPRERAPGALTPLPVRGAPPRNYAAPRDQPAVAASHRAPAAIDATEGQRRPRWERLPAAAVEAAHSGGCGCVRCGGGP